MQNQIHPRDLIVGLQKGLALIQLFSKEHPRLTVPQAAKMSGLTQSAARRFFLTLLHERYLQTDGRHYWLTPKALRLGQAYVDSAQFPRMVRPIVEYIASRTEEHASVGVIREQRTPYTVTDVAALMEKIAQVRRQGYAAIEQEFEIGMLVLAVPLSDREGLYWGALSLTSHQSRTSIEALCRDHLDLLYSAQAMLVG